MEKYCDLHTHSYYSDGTYSPAQVLKAAEAENLSAVALCDHNNISGLPEFLATGAQSPVEAVPGVEFSADYEGTELHILGLFIRPEHYGAVNSLLEEGRKRKEQSNVLLVQNLNRAGFPLELEKLRKSTGNEYVNRAHIAVEMTRLGYTRSVEAAFDHWLSPEKGLYIPPRWIDVLEIIRFIRGLGAAAVLAHPFLRLNEDKLREFLPGAVSAGLSGMEVRYSRYDCRTTQLAEQLAGEYGLLPSGGSDFHGEAKPDIRIGTGKGDLRVPAAWCENLKNAATRDKPATM